MTEEEYFRKNYHDYCYGERLLSPYWDLFQDGVEFGERQSEKKIEELEKENAELKSIAGFQQSSNMKRYFEIQELEKKNKKLESDFRICEKNADTYYDQLTKAKEIIKNCIHILKHSGTALDWKTVINQAEQFLKGE